MLTQHCLFTAHQAEGVFRICARHSTGAHFSSPEAKPVRPVHTPANGAAFRRPRAPPNHHLLHDVRLCIKNSLAMPANRQRLFVAHSRGLPLGCRRSSPAGIAVPVTANAGVVCRQHHADFVKARAISSQSARNGSIHQHNSARRAW